MCDTDPDCYDSRDESEDLCKNVGLCGGDFKNKTGIIFSPTYPDNYPENTDCVYTISQPKGTVILLNFISLRIEAHPTCDFDFLEIRDGSSGAPTVLDSLCGYKIPAPIQSSHNQLWMM